MKQFVTFDLINSVRKKSDTVFYWNYGKKEPLPQTICFRVSYHMYTRNDNNPCQHQAYCIWLLNKCYIHVTTCSDYYLQQSKQSYGFVFCSHRSTPLRKCCVCLYSWTVKCRRETSVSRSGILVGEVNLVENVREPTKELLSNLPLVDLYCRFFDWKCLTHNKTVIRNVNGKSENDVVVHCIRTIYTKVT